MFDAIILSQASNDNPDNHYAKGEGTLSATPKQDCEGVRGRQRVHEYFGAVKRPCKLCAACNQEAEGVRYSHQQTKGGAPRKITPRAIARLKKRVKEISQNI